MPWSLLMPPTMVGQRQQGVTTEEEGDRASFPSRGLTTLENPRGLSDTSGAISSGGSCSSEPILGWQLAVLGQDHRILELACLRVP